MRELIHITKALSDPNRVRIVLALREGELCVCQIQQLLGLATSTTSKHLSVLGQAGLVEFRKEGRWAYYRLGGDGESPAVEEILRWVLRHAAGDREVLRDRERLKEILTYSPEELCQLIASGQKCCSSARETPAAARWPKGGHTPSAAT